MSEANKISQAFVEVVGEWSTKAEWNEIRRRNAKESNPSICHTHDFMDANMAMAEAFIRVLGREPFTPMDVEEGTCADSIVEADTALWNEAWRKAMPYLTEGGVQI